MQPSSDAIRLQLERILAGESFAHSDRLRRFLRYVVERALAGEGDQLKEYAIGVEVFDRNDQYDPRLDSIVRVEAGRLRTKVEEYYARQGSNDEVVIRIPRGSYAPVFDQRQVPLPAVPEAEGSRRKPIGRLVGWRVGGGVLIALILLAAIVASRARIWTSAPRVTPSVTIAILPFAHYSTDAADQLLAARLSDGVTGELARIGTVGVVSHTSALQFAAARRPLREVAEALKADVVMEATLLNEGDRVRVQARLVDATLDRKFWVQDFVANATDVRELEHRIATAAAAAALKFRKP